MKNKIYIPQQVETLIQGLDFKRKDDLRIICDMVYRRQIYFKSELQKKYGYIEIPRTAFLKVIGCPKSVNKAITILAENDIIIRNDYYIRGLQCKGYKLANELLGSKISIEIRDNGINKRLMKLRTEIRKQKVTNLEFAKTKYYKTFNIDTAGALNAANNKAMYEIYDLCEKLKFPISYQGIENIINCTGDYVKNRGLILISNGGKELHHILHRLMVHQIQINSISDGWLFFKRNSTNGRLDTNLTSLPSYLRKFIISDETLYNLDIKNSQPYFLSVLIKNDNKINPEELLRYTQIVTKGDFYEYLRDEYYNTFKINKERSQMKSMIFKIYYSKVTSYAKDKGFFRSLFPTIMDYIDRTNAECNSKLANSLSTMESFTILDKVMVDLQSKGINPFTIHDSFIVTEKELPIVKQTFIRIVGELHGILPMLHEEELFDIVDDFESEIEENYDWVIDELED